MRIKRVLQGTALTALAAAAWMGAGSTDASAKASCDGITTDDNGNYVLEVTGEHHEIMVGIAKVNKSGIAKVTSWDVYDGESASVDLSKLNVANDNYIAIKDNDEQVTFIGIAAASKKNTILFNAATGKITGVDTKIGNTPGKATNVEYRTANSNWAESESTDKIDLSTYQYQGATLYVRIPADKKAASSTLKATVKYGEKNKEVDYTVQPVGSLPSKETKLNVKKQANGPTVALDYAKGTAKVKKGTEYRVVGSTVVSGGTIEAVGANGSTFNVTKLVEAVSANDTEAVLEVRTKAKTDGSTVKQNKVASKWTRVSIQKLKAFVSGGNKLNDSEYAKVTSGASADIASVSGGVIKVQFTTSGKNANKKISGISIENTSDNAYEIAVETTGSAIKKLAKKKTLKLSPSAGQKIYIRVAGDKKNKVWVGDWACLGKVAKLEDGSFVKVD